MLDIAVPGYRHFHFEHLLLDYNGTLACDGQLLNGVATAVQQLAHKLEVHVLTADTFGSARAQLESVECHVHVLEASDYALAKFSFMKNLGCEHAVAIGNGRNDRIMLKRAALGIAVIAQEGAALEAVLAADVLVHNIHDAFALLLEPRRLIADLRA